MRIQHNMAAMNSLSNYAGNNKTLSGNLEKLSSGYQINSAADNAAGLAISEKMRSQIAGLEKAQDNANDGISLVQTAEGALTEVNSMLTRLTELATQSANGTYEDGVDRANIQEETDALLSEIDRISQSTNFNGITLLDGSLSGGGTSGTALKGAQIATFKNATTTSDATSMTGVTFGNEKIQVDDAEVTVKWGDLSTDEQEALKVDFSTNKSKAKGDEAAQIMQDTINNALKDAGFSNSVTVSAKTDTTNGGTKFTITSNTGDNNSSLGLAAGSSSVLSTLFGYGSSATTELDGSTKANATQKISASDDMNAVFNMNINGTDYKVDMSKAGKLMYKSSTAVKTATNTDVESASYYINTAGGTRKKATAVSELHDYMLSGGKVYSASSMGAGEVDVTDSSKAISVSDYDSNVTGEEIAADLEKAISATIASYNEAASDDKQLTASDITVEFTSDGKLKINNATDANISFSDPTGTDTAAKALGIASGSSNVSGNGLTLQVGDTNADYQKVTVSIQDMSSNGLGLKNLDLSNQDAAGEAITTIKNAVNTVSKQRGQLGALQNRLDHTLNNLDATTQNITASESQIRDTDMAKEMTKYSKNNILVQAAQSMLAQANSMPQGVLQLLG